MRKSEFLKSIQTPIVFLLSLVMMMTSVYAWFFGSRSVYNIEIYTSSVDCDVSLFRVDDDIFFNGVFNDDFDFESFSVLRTHLEKDKTKFDGDYYTDVDKVEGSLVFRNTSILPQDDEPDDDNTTQTFTLTNVVSGGGLSKNQVKLSEIKANQVDKYRLSDIYPSTITTFALAITNTKATNKGSVEILFDAYTPTANPNLSEVLSINFRDNKKLLYNPSYSDEQIPLYDVAEYSNEEDDNNLVIAGGETIWLFFYYKFETLPSLQTLNSTKFDETKTNLNEYQNLTSVLPTLRINYVLLGTVDQIT